MRPRAGVRAASVVATLALALTAAGCKDVLDVENPNNLIEEDLGNPASAAPAVNGAAGTVARGIGAMMGPYSIASDEVVWIGSRDAWRELDQGFTSNERNEFTDDAYRFFSQGRFMADEAIRRLEGFDGKKELANRDLLAQSYLYGAIAYTTAADMYDTFVLSDRREAGKPIAPAEMVKLYDTALGYINKGLAVSQATAATRTALLGMKARASFSKALWAKLNPEGQLPANPLVGDATATADATAALAAMTPDYRFVLSLSNDDLAYAGEASLAYNVNQRGEMAIAPIYGSKAAGATLRDPIDNIPDPALDRALKEFFAGAGGPVYQPITIVSARELRLILAEGALARNDLVEFARQINAVRALDRLTPWAGQIPALDMLRHARRVNLFVQGRRLADHYRFRDPSVQWIPGSTSLTRPGTFFPVTCIEIRSHPQDFPGVSC